MDDSTSTPPQPLGEHVRFFGAISASVSHEMNNVFSILEQVNGLLEDQLYAMQTGAELDPAKLESIQERIQAQIDRGVGIVHELNRFSHTVDERTSAWDVNEMLGTVQLLYGRFANLKTLTLIVEPFHGTMLIDKNLFLVEKLLYHVLRAILDSDVTENSDITLTVGAQDKRANFIFWYQADSDLTADAIRSLPAVPELLDALQADIATVEKDHLPGIRISFPAAVVAGA